MKLLNRQQMKQAETETVRRGIGWSRLMENAGAAFSKTLKDRISVSEKRVAVVVGSGNNGGDGYVAARKLKESGASVLIIRAFGSPLTPQSEEMSQKAAEFGVKMINFSDDPEYARTMLSGVELIIDAVFGIGFHGAADREAAVVFDAINNSPAKVISVDVPSGISADTGEVIGAAVRADLTIALAAIKACHVSPPASDFCGEVLCCSIGIPDEVMNSFYEAPETIEPADVKMNLPVRQKSCNKGTNGTAMFLCGSYGMAGAAILAGKAASRSGAGLVKMAAPESIYPILAASLPEAVHLPLAEAKQGTVSLAAADKLKNSLSSASALCIGCGLGKGIDIAPLLCELTSSASCPVILDADGINAAAGCIDIIERHSSPMIITPHPGEMARLFKTDAAQINADRIGYAVRAAKRFGVTVVLKGSNTVVATAKGRVFVNMNGNPGMATAGAGDALSGIITAFAAQGLSPEAAACCGVYVHAAAGDLACDRFTELGMTVEDMIGLLPAAFQSILC